MSQIVNIPGDEAAFQALFEKLATDLSERGYGYVDQFLKDPEVRAVLTALKHHYEQDTFKQAGIGASHEFQVEQAVRGDKIHWITPQDALPPTKVFISRIRDLMQYINRSCYLGLKDFEMHYTMYPSGTFYKRHLDQFKVSDHRRLTFIFYLNVGWEPEHGGLLRVYLNDAGGGERPFDIEPKAGRLVCFRSDLLEHEVLVCSKPRYSITGWMLDQMNELTFL